MDPVAPHLWASQDRRPSQPHAMYRRAATRDQFSAFKFTCSATTDRWEGSRDWWVCISVRPNSAPPLRKRWDTHLNWGRMGMSVQNQELGPQRVPGDGPPRPWWQVEASNGGKRRPGGGAGRGGDGGLRESEVGTRRDSLRRRQKGRVRGAKAGISGESGVRWSEPSAVTCGGRMRAVGPGDLRLELPSGLQSWAPGSAELRSKWLFRLSCGKRGMEDEQEPPLQPRTQVTSSRHPHPLNTLCACACASAARCGRGYALHEPYAQTISIRAILVRLFRPLD